MNRIYKPTIRRGARIRVLNTGELGTIADKILIRKDGKVRTYCKVRLDKNPMQDTWLFADRLVDTKECAFVSFGDDTDKKIIVGVEFDHEKNCVSKMKVQGVPDDIDCHHGLYRYLAAILVEALRNSRP